MIINGERGLQGNSFFFFFIYTFIHLKQKNTINKYVNINVPEIQVKKA